MKAFFSLLFFTQVALAADAEKDFNLVAESTDCAEKVQILAKEGEKYVLAVHGKKKEKLFSRDGSTFAKMNPKNTEYVSAKKDVSFVHPSYVEGNPAKVSLSPESEYCRMSLK